MRYINAIKTIRQETNNYLKDFFSKNPVNLTLGEETILNEVEKKGFCVIPDFYNESECMEMRQEIDRLMEKYKSGLFVDKNDSDHRIFGADRLSPIIAKFISDSFITKIVHSHEGSLDVKGVTMAAKLEYKANNEGSGAGWHRDTPHSKQIKSLVYLSDVDMDSGPFQYLENSHREWNMLRDSFLGNFEFNQYRYENSEIESLPYSKENKIKTITGKAGSVIIANTRGLHRGMPIKRGTRYALTNYYWTNKPIPEETKELMAKFGIKI